MKIRLNKANNMLLKICFFSTVKIFEKYSINEAIYDSAFKKFTHDREKWESFFDLANVYLDTLKANVKTRTAVERPSQF